MLQLRDVSSRNGRVEREGVIDRNGIADALHVPGQKSIT